MYNKIHIYSIYIIQQLHFNPTFIITGFNKLTLVFYSYFFSKTTQLTYKKNNIFNVSLKIKKVFLFYILSTIIPFNLTKQPIIKAVTSVINMYCSSRTKFTVLIFYTYWQIIPELFCNVLNPAHVPPQRANSPTLGTASSPRKRKADIEVPSNPSDKVSSGFNQPVIPSVPKLSFNRQPIRKALSVHYSRLTSLLDSLVSQSSQHMLLR